MSHPDGILFSGAEMPRKAGALVHEALPLSYIENTRVRLRSGDGPKIGPAEYDIFVFSEQTRFSDQGECSC